VGLQIRKKNSAFGCESKGITTGYKAVLIVLIIISVFYTTPSFPWIL
jgi:hypothetical protein